MNEIDKLQRIISQQRTEIERLLEDKARLDWLDSMSDGRCWIARHSTTGRGFRLHNDSVGSKTVRDAIDAKHRDQESDGE
jgi:hypothetical protein